MLRVKCDMDNTINSLMRTSLEYLKQIAPEFSNISYDDIIAYDLNNLPYDARRIIVDGWTKKSMWDSLKPLDEAQQYLNKINNDFELILVTPSEPYIVDWKTESLQTYFPYIDASQICNIGQQRSWIMTDFSIDDYPENLKSDFGHRILIDCPWNNDVKDDVWSFIRVSNLKEAYEFMIAKEVEERCL